MTYEEFKMTVLKSKKLEDIRPGQQAFNLLAEINPTMSEKVRGRIGIDPFYVDSYLPAFWQFLEKNWETDEAE